MNQAAGHDLGHHGGAEPGAELNLAVSVRATTAAGSP